MTAGTQESVTGLYGFPRVAFATRRVMFAAFVAVLAVGYAWLSATLHPGPRDFDQIWFAARAMWGRGDPYPLIGPGRAFEWPWLFYYPLSSGVLILPLAGLPILVARLFFIGAGAFAFAYVLKPHQYPVLLSASFVVAVQSAQWSPLLIGAACLPGLAWLLAAKPNVGLALLAAFGSAERIALAGLAGVLAVLVAILFVPDWPQHWITAVRLGKPSSILLFTTFGWLLLASAFRWRRPEARLLFALACIPQTVAAYETLPLMLIAETKREAYVLAVLSYLPWLAQIQSANSGHYNTSGVHAWYVLALYLPALVMILRRGSLPDVSSDPPRPNRPL